VCISSASQKKVVTAAIAPGFTNEVQQAIHARNVLSQIQRRDFAILYVLSSRVHLTAGISSIRVVVGN